MHNIRLFVGPMTKNVVSAVLKFNKRNPQKMVGFIPSRRQVSVHGGYVNGWTTKSFREAAQHSFICRDHAGPGQGTFDDDGYESLTEDCRYFDMVHIDPWKKHQGFQEGLRHTIDMISHCYQRNNNILFEVGTEEAIRRFSTAELDKLLSELNKQLGESIFKNIKYCVIQSGTSLEGSTNTGSYSETRLRDMLSVVKEYDLLTKEHNGDFLSPTLIKSKFNIGLDSINIAPEFGRIEARAYIRSIKNNNLNLLDTYWQICYNSRKWEKWVGEDFDPFCDKERLIDICGHYVLSDNLFINKIANNLPSVDKVVEEEVIKKLSLLHE